MSSSYVNIYKEDATACKDVNALNVKGISTKWVQLAVPSGTSSSFTVNTHAY